MLNFEKVLGNGGKVIEVAAKSIKDIATSKKHNDVTKKIEFLKTWEQEFGGARTIDEINEYEFRVKCEGIRFMLEMITDADGNINRERRQVTIDYVKETGLALNVGISKSGKADYRSQFMKCQKLNVIHMDADYAFAVSMGITVPDESGNMVRITSPIVMAYIPELRIVNDVKKVVYKMELIDRRNKTACE